MRETDDEVVRRARIYVDTRAGAFGEAGDILLPLQAGVIAKEAVLGDLYELARAAVAIGVAAVFMETHQDPDRAPSDGPNMLHLKDVPALLSELVELDRIAKRRAAASQ